MQVRARIKCARVTCMSTVMLSLCNISIIFFWVMHYLKLNMIHMLKIDFRYAVRCSTKTCIIIDKRCTNHGNFYIQLNSDNNQTLKRSAWVDFDDGVTNNKDHRPTSR
ncbi:hypothetical protein EDC96DRAFT_545850 [Choanephora cucurbitarum]|nr:hypothetical protein EDC96DRAFT_545850 [Choanephora cucurbitarum]